MGRSRGGLTTKIHALVDAEGRPVALALTAGQTHDSVMAAVDIGKATSGLSFKTQSGEKAQIAGPFFFGSTQGNVGASSTIDRPVAATAPLRRPYAARHCSCSLARIPSAEGVSNSKGCSRNVTAMARSKLNSP
jgi:hypothetical protein